MGRVVPSPHLFVSYSHKDKKYLNEFKLALAPVLMDDLIDFWDDSRIVICSEWKEEIQKALNAAQVAILLVSQHFLASTFIVKNEFQPLLDKARDNGVKIFWVCLTDCLLEKTGIETYQAAHDIKKPLNTYNYQSRVNKWADISRDLIKIIHTIPSFEEDRRVSRPSEATRPINHAMIKASLGLVSNEQIIERIIKNGAVFDCDLVHEDYYFDKPTELNSFARTDEAMRLRVSRNETENKEEAILSYKGPKNNDVVKAREEIDIIVSDTAKFRRIFAVLGFKEIIVVKKARKHYTHGDISIMLDRVENLPGMYIDVEILTEDEIALDAKRKQLFHYLKSIGIDWGALESRSYLELVVLAQMGKSDM